MASQNQKRRLGLQAETSRSNVGPRENPLLNLVVLQKVFEHSSVKDLSNARLVCRQWFSASLKYCRIRKSIGISDDPCTECSYNVDEVEYDHSRKDFLKFTGSKFSKKYLQFEKMPFRSFHLPNWNFDRYSKSMKTFWSAHEVSITYLAVNPVHISKGSCGAFTDLVYTRLIHLKTLICDIMYTDKGDSKNGEQRTFKEEDLIVPECRHCNLKTLKIEMQEGHIRSHNFIMHYPFLENLCLVNIGVSSLINILRGIKKMRATIGSKIYALKCLDLSAMEVSGPAELNMLPDLLQLLQEIAFPLDCFKVNLQLFKSDNNNSLQEIIRVHRKTLKTFEVKDYTFTRIQLPIMQNVECVEQVTFNDCYPVSMSFVKYFPNLKVLTISGQLGLNSIKSTIMPEIKELQLLKLTELNFTYKNLSSATITSRFGALKFRNLTLIMPNLTILKMPLKNESFRLICKNLVNLEEIIVEADGEGVDDEGILGLKKCEGWRRIAGRELPSIVNLQKLQKFKIKSSNNPCLTNRSVYMGFMKLPVLRILKINLAKITPKAQRALQHTIVLDA